MNHFDLIPTEGTHCVTDPNKPSKMDLKEGLYKFFGEFGFLAFQLILSLLMPMALSLLQAWRKAGAFYFNYLDLFSNRELIYVFVCVSAVTLLTLRKLPPRVLTFMRCTYFLIIMAGVLAHIFVVNQEYLLDINYDSRGLILWCLIICIFLNCGSLLVCAFCEEKK